MSSLRTTSDIFDESGFGQIGLAGDRALGYAEYGDTMGTAVLYCHGLPGSRLEARFADEIARAESVRIVAVDRPGFGRSDLLPGRCLGDWPADVLALTEQLGIERFHVLGMSGGAPYALCLGQALPDRVATIALVSALGPVNDTGGASPAALRLLAHFGGLCEPLSTTIDRVVRLPYPLPRWLLSLTLAKVDCCALRDSDFGPRVMASMREAFRCGPAGVAADLRILAGPWGFSPAQVRVPTRLWHGELDRVVRPAMGRWLARNLACCEAVFLEHEGHYSLIHHHAQAILHSMMQPRTGLS